VSISTSSGASGADPIVVTYDAPTTTVTPLPQISPQTEGSWSQPTPATWQFTPTVPFVPDTSVTVTAGSKQFTYKVADGSLLRAQQLLADLHYLPLNFNAAVPIANTAAVQGALACAPPAGDFAMRYDSTPAELAALWSPGKMTAVTKGAIMAFENVHHLAIDGIAGPAVWTALLQDAVAGAVDPQPYTWAWTTMKRPETLRIWSDGDFVFSSKANTGISAAETPIGSWPVFSRFRTQTMKGTNPDGTKYNDPGVPFISYFYQGDAIHGFKRASYGSPQSLGCVELPYDAAQTVWNLIDYGTVVTVTHA
jgi:peptidoglycan hydrolase-like protein with peptidoglycan-binding domain